MAIDVEAYYRRYGPQVLRRCRFLLRDEEKAVDAMHDVFVQLLRYQGGLKNSAPSSLLHQIATRVCLNRLRGARRRPEDKDDELVLRIAAPRTPRLAPPRGACWIGSSAGCPRRAGTSPCCTWWMG